MQGLPTLKAFGQSHAYGRMLADKARALCDSTFWVLATSVLTRGIHRSRHRAGRRGWRWRWVPGACSTAT